MKQPNDDKTIELTIDAKRGRGRPSLANALTPAERAKRYRANRKASGVKSDATENQMQTVWHELAEELQAEIKELIEWVSFFT